MRGWSEAVNAAFTGACQLVPMQLSAATVLADPLPEGGSESTIYAALLDSRRRWRGLLGLATDFAFETDAAGRFSFVWPSVVLGWPESSLVGRPARAVLPTLAEGFSPFAATEPVRNRSAWLRTRDGGVRLLRFAVEPLPGGHGVRGVAVDVTAENEVADEAAARRRRQEVADHVTTSLRQELLVPRMIATVLGSATAALGAEGAAVMLGNAIRHQTGPVPPGVLPRAAGAPNAGHRTRIVSGGTQTTLAVPVPDRLGLNATLVFWRAAQGRRWDGEDNELAASVANAVRVVLEQDELRREMARMSRTDPLTGLLNRRAFADELERRLLRVETQSGPGVLLHLDLDEFTALNRVRGHEVGDTVLAAVATLLRRTFRPTDLLGRPGGNQFVVWLDGADEMTAAERAEDLRGGIPAVAASALPPESELVTASIGIAPAGRNGADCDELLRRADAALSAAKNTGKGGWQVLAAVEP